MNKLVKPKMICSMCIELFDTDLLHFCECDKTLCEDCRVGHMC